MSETALLMQQRTPEQDAAYMEALYMADRISHEQRLYFSDDEFGRMYAATLKRHLLQALEPIHKAKANYLYAVASPTVVLGPEGAWKFMQPAPSNALTLLDELEQSIAARYTKGLSL